MLTKEQIEQTLRNLYSRENWKNMLTNLFAEHDGNVQWELQPTETALGNKTKSYRAKNLFRLGSVELSDGKVLNIYEAEVQNTRIAENRVGLRSLVQSAIIPGFNDAALAVFHSAEQPEWRFTFMSKWEYPEDSGKVVKHETHPKKFTYVLGPSESNRTARDRFYALQAKPNTLQSVVDAFSVAKLSKEFFDEYRQQYNAFYDYLKNSSFGKSVFEIPKIKDVAENDKAEKPIRDFVKRLMGRIVFLYFLQKKGWLQSIWAKPPEIKPDATFMTHLFQFADKKKDFYSTYLLPLFFKTLNKERKDDIFKVEQTVLGKIPYLNGGLFETDFKGVEDIRIKNDLFQKLFTFFDSFNFTIIEDSPDEREVAVDPEMLGHIFENLIEENKRFGTFYTPKEVVHFMTQEALLLHISKKISLQSGSEEWKSLKQFIQYKEPNAFIRKKASAIDAELDSLKVCDPAIGSGAFPMGILLEVYQMKLQLYALTNPGTAFIPSEVKEKIIRNSIYGVDIDKGAIDIARLRFWLSLIVDLDKPRPLPNFDYKFMQGNSLKEDFESIPLKFESKAVQVKLVKQVDLFGKPVNPQISITEFVQSGNFAEELDVLNLEEKLFNTYDSAEKEKIRRELLRVEKKFLQYNIDQQLEKAKQSLASLKEQLKRQLENISELQKKQVEARAQKKIKGAEDHIEEINRKAELLKELNVYEKPYFLWHLYFKHVFDNGGFDIIIANPPYGVKADDDLYAQSNLGSKDSYGFFIKLAIETLLKENGTLVYIVSDTWLTIKSHLPLRQLVLKNQLHKVIRLHPDTFGAVVNTCIFSLTKVAGSTPSPLERAGVRSADSEVLAADLTNLSTKKSLPEFREKLWHLNDFAGEFNERYAVYKYPQQLIITNSNLPIFTASPKVFALMNDSTCDKEKRTMQAEDNDKEIEVRKIKLNDREVELVRFGDVAEVKQGLATGDNQYYLYQKPEAHGSYTDINGYREYLLTENDLKKIRGNDEIRLKVIEKGIHQSEDERGFDKDRWFGGRYIVPYDKGGESDTEEGWLPNYYVPTGYYIDWSTKSVRRLKNYTIAQRIKDRKENKTIKLHYKTTAASVIRNPSDYFKDAITFSRTGMYAPTFRVGNSGIFDSKSDNVYFSLRTDEKLYLALLNSKLIKFIFKSYLCHTVQAEGDSLEDVVLLRKSTTSAQLLLQLVQKIIDKQRESGRYQYLSNEQKDIDRLVYELYGLNEEDIQEVEYWWTRRYPRLARFADTKPLLSVKDKQEQLARLHETIARGENKYCEFKSSLRLDIKKGTIEKYIEHTAFKNIAAFLNSEGGTLIIGVDDEKNILGLEQTDYTTFSKHDKQDEWSKHLDNLIQNFLGNKVHAFLQTQHITVDDKTVAVIEVKPSPNAIWLKNNSNEEFYIRRTASATQLSGSEAVEYIRNRFGNEYYFHLSKSARFGAS